MTKSKKAFLDKYKHPLWQKRRLEIFEKAKFQCQMCYLEDKTLHVHHQYYEYGKDPWDYPDESLHCLCEDCHKKAESNKKALKELAKIFPPYDAGEMLGYMYVVYKEIT